jgi:hypothetical protein
MILTVCSWEKGALVAKGLLNTGAGVIILHTLTEEKAESKYGNVRMSQARKPFQWNMGPEHGTQKRYRGRKPRLEEYFMYRDAYHWDIM